MERFSEWQERKDVQRNGLSYVNQVTAVWLTMVRALLSLTDIEKAIRKAIIGR